MSEADEINDPDRELVRRACEGESRAFDELVIKYSRKLYGLVYHMTSNAEDTNDLLQEIFAKAYKSLGNFRGRSTFYTWIYTIATNLTLNFLKKRKRRAAWSLDESEAGLQNDPSLVDLRHEANPHHQMRVHEIQKRLNEAMQSLSDEQRAVVTMFDIQGLPHAEISNILEITEGTVRSRLHYAHQRLQGLLTDLL